MNWDSIVPLLIGAVGTLGVTMVSQWQTNRRADADRKHALALRQDELDRQDREKELERAQKQATSEQVRKDLEIEQRQQIHLDFIGRVDDIAVGIVDVHPHELTKSLLEASHSLNRIELRIPKVQSSARALFNAARQMHVSRDAGIQALKDAEESFYAARDIYMRDVSLYV